MAFNRPTLSDLITRIQTDLASRITSGSTLLRRTVINVFGVVFAGAVHLVYGYLDYIFKQVFPDDALADPTSILRWGKIYGLSLIPASYCLRDCTFTGTDGVVIPAFRVWQDASGNQFSTNIPATPSGGTITVGSTALIAGAASNLATGTSVTLVSPIAGISSTGTVASSNAVDGEDQETVIPEFQARLLNFLRQPPHGGNANDYVQWALQNAGVTRAWSYPNNTGAGTVGVAFVMDNNVPIIPTSPEVAVVQAYIAALCPVTADVTVFAPVADTTNFTVHISPDTTALRTAVAAQLLALLQQFGQPGGTIYLSQIQEVVESTSGITDSSITTPNANLVSSAGHIPVMGTITWV